ncbi:hypothetical protein EDE05_12836 [Neorhizobium sp. R1-B]|uniref:DUF6525 family protein n=1 Tax=Neorhizobium sp. R1-B TaxID=2485162 RepID=UPI0010656EDC|nr:DUF6525 family protein [Neorhizobium sp. R1-B]TDX72615.1 hypothetical protein EDE05_12836 [Neorhizobium sp. R1-B]
MNILAISDRIEVMRAYDDLPDRLRRAIAAASFPYDPREISDRLRKGRRAETVARSIERLNRRKAL